MYGLTVDKESENHERSGFTVKRKFCRTEKCESKVGKKDALGREELSLMRWESGLIL